jgi:cadmium resistance protein CadD (predicted permease)
VSLAVTVASAVLAFAATNVDDLVVLAVLLAAGNRPRRVLAGQYLGFAAIVGVSAVVARGALILPRAWVGLLGLAPLLLGLRGLVRLRSVDHGDEPRGVLSTFGIAAITLANGGDNIGVYVPMLTTTRGLDLAIVLLVFAVLVAAWCTLAHAFVRSPRVATVFEHWGHRLAPVVFVGLGVYILLDAGSFALLPRLLR